MLVVVTIIGFLAAMAIPHLTGMTSANSMNLATQQMLSDVGLARQLAISHRTTVYMVFASPSLAALSQPNNEVTAYTNVLSHQYSAYALVSLSSVGDQPGAHYPQYLTPWKTLPQGVFIPTYKFTATSPTLVVTTNTLSGTTNGFPIRVFTNITPVTSVANIVTFPFPAVDTVTAANVPLMVALPYVGFTSSGQLTSLSSGLDEYIPLARGSVFNFPNGAQANELPTGNSINNATIIHIDALTGRAKIERNQF
jgi:type II secretory pathway pseudopilin PulG